MPRSQQPRIRRLAPAGVRYGNAAVPIAALAVLIQMLVGLGTVGVDVMKVRASFETLHATVTAQSRTVLTPEETTQVHTTLAELHPDFTGVDFLKASATGGTG